jgi:hypothetical protein
MDKEQFSLPGSILSLPTPGVIAHLLAFDDFVVDGFQFYQSFDAGLVVGPL